MDSTTGLSIEHLSSNIGTGQYLVFSNKVDRPCWRWTERSTYLHIGRGISKRFEEVSTNDDISKDALVVTVESEGTIIERTCRI
jgi:hypothetical protein